MTPSRLQKLGNARVLAAFVSIALAMPAMSSAAEAQVSPPRTNTLSTTVSGVFSVAPLVPALTQSSQTGNLCSPGACYNGTVTARGNQRWQLQVKLVSIPGTFTVAYVQTSVSGTAQAVNSGQQTWLDATTWLTVASSTHPSAGTPIGVMFNARKGSGKTGIQPTGAQLAATVMYRVIALP